MENVIEAGTDFPSNVVVLQALRQVLSSGVFCKAPRLSRLLAFLVEKKLSGTVRETSEYAIGIDVFDRDPATYSTCADPIVRVQVGRLRGKLKSYYAADGAHAPLCFTIPLGSYMPEIGAAHQVQRPPAVRHLLAVMPLTLLSGEADGAATIRGMNEELAYQLYMAFGPSIVPHAIDQAGKAAGGALGHRLEGSVRVQGKAIRASIRLIDSTVGCIEWSAQFDRSGPLAIAQQEELAVAVCCSLKQYFAQG